MNIKSYRQIQKKLQEKEITLVAVSKTKPISDIQTLYEQGQRVFGENRAKELQQKYRELPKDIEWHMIGHTQSKKVKYIAPFVSLIHSVDSLSLLQEIDKRAKQNDRLIPILLQFHIAEEESKYGFSLQKVDELIANNSLNSFNNILIKGVMGMATFTNDKSQVRDEFKKLKRIFDHLKHGYFRDSEEFKTLSMGMSGDFEIAIEEGSNMVRLGSLIFGERNYTPLSTAN